MIYINKKDFKIVNSINPLDENEYFECDELIAPAIRSFNKKGYETAFCCSGHITPMISDLNCCIGTELYVTFKKINPNKNLLKLFKFYTFDLLNDFTIIEEKNSPNFLFSIRYEFGKNFSDPYKCDTRQIAEIYKELLDVNQKLFEIARKIPHKRQLNKSFHGKRGFINKNIKNKNIIQRRSNNEKQ